MIRRLFVISLCLICACTTTNIENSANPTSDTRYAYAIRLSETGQLSQALFQWQILALRYPNNAKIENTISALKKDIDTRVVRLELKLKDLGSSASERKRQEVLLKILALQPNHTLAKDSLRQLKSKQELAKVTQKNHSTYQLFAENVKQAKQNKALSDLLLKAEKHLANQQYLSVLTTTEEIQQLVEKHSKIKPLSYAAWLGLADESKIQNQPEQTIARLNEALAYAAASEQQGLRDRIAAIRKTESDRLYASAMKIFKTDIQGAVKLLQKAASFNPEDTRTMQQLSRAQTIQKNLNLIKNNPVPNS